MLVVESEGGVISVRVDTDQKRTGAPPRKEDVGRWAGMGGRWRENLEPDPFGRPMVGVRSEWVRPDPFSACYGLSRETRPILGPDPKWVYGSETGFRSAPLLF